MLSLTFFFFLVYFYPIYCCDVGVKNQGFINYLTTELHLQHSFLIVFAYCMRPWDFLVCAHACMWKSLWEPGTTSGGRGFQEVPSFPPPSNMSQYLFACKYACVAHVCLVHTKARRGYWIPCNWSYNGSCLRVLRTKPRSSSTANSSSHFFSLKPYCLFF